MTEVAQTEASPEVGQSTSTAAEALDTSDVLQHLFIHQQQLVVTQVQGPELVKFVENPDTILLLETMNLI